jgi:hypothetical protein
MTDLYLHAITEIRRIGDDRLKMLKELVDNEFERRIERESNGRRNK